MTNIEILRATKERLFERGWGQGSLGLQKGPNCLVGALFNVSNVTSDHVIYELLAENIDIDVGFWVGRGLWKIESYNDQVATTFDDIVDLIDRTIKSIEQEN